VTWHGPPMTDLQSDDGDGGVRGRGGHQHWNKGAREH
jgi:hypothetical protein